MSPDDRGLGELVSEWAEGHEEDCDKWMKELAEHSIRSKETLVKRARGSRWRSTLDKISDGLATMLEVWYWSASEVEGARSRKRKAEENETISRTQKQRNLLELPRLLTNAIDPDSENNLRREDLVDRLWNMISRHPFVLISSPPATGKTSLLQLVHKKYRIDKYIRCHKSSDPYELLCQSGIDLRTGQVLGSERGVIVALDDAQNIYEHNDFWETLLKELPVRCPSGFSFIISATHNLRQNQSSPVGFGSLPRISKSDLLISEREAEELIDLTCYNEIVVKTSPAIRHAIIRECCGIIGAVRLAVMKLCERFDQDSAAESQILQFFFSDNFSQHLDRLFSVHLGSILPVFRDFLKACFVQTTTRPMLLDSESKKILVQLLKGGVLEEVSWDSFRFSSPLAKRFYFGYVFPNRSMVVPSSVFDLVRGAIQNMSSATLQNATVDGNDFPKETVFQHEFMAGLAAVLPPRCYICPELSRVFPDDVVRDGKIEGEIDFYINGDLRWGIEVLVMRDRLSEHLDRFSDPSGKYFPLRVKDYAVVDFRRSLDGNPTKVLPHDKRVTVFFGRGDFTRCVCRFGMDPTTKSLSLSS